MADQQRLAKSVESPLHSLAIQSGAIKESQGTNGVYSIGGILFDFDDSFYLSITGIDVFHRFEILFVDLLFGEGLIEHLNRNHTYPKFQKLHSWPSDLGLEHFLSDNKRIAGIQLLRSIDDSYEETKGITFIHDSALIFENESGIRLSMNIDYIHPWDMLISTSIIHIESLYTEAADIVKLL